MHKWRTETKCSYCPFSNEGEGVALRNSFDEQHWVDVVLGLKDGKRIDCRKEAGLYCAGALEFQSKFEIGEIIMNFYEQIAQLPLSHQNEIINYLQEVRREAVRNLYKLPQHISMQELYWCEEDNEPVSFCLNCGRESEDGLDAMAELCHQCSEMTVYGARELLAIYGKKSSI